jgi:hypothetical protein
MDRTSLYFIFIVAALSLIVSLDVYGQTTDGEQAPQVAPQAAPQTDVSPQSSQTSNDNAPKTSSEPGNNDPLEEYRTRVLDAKFSLWKGLNVFRAGNPIELGYYGRYYKDIFAGSSAALDSMSKFRSMRIAGSALWLAGIALLITDIVLVATENSSFVSIDNDRGEISVESPFWFLLALGLVSSISGVCVEAGAYGYLTDAIEQYNADLVVQIRERPVNLTMRRAPGLSVRGSF